MVTQPGALVINAIKIFMATPINTVISNKPIKIFLKESGKETVFKLPKIKMPDVKGTLKKVKDSTVNATKKATDAVRDQAKKISPFKKNK